MNLPHWNVYINWFILIFAVFLCNLTSPWNSKWQSKIAEVHPQTFGSSPSPGSRPRFLWLWLSGEGSQIKKRYVQFDILPLVHGVAHFSLQCDFMMDLGKPKRWTKFEIASFIRYENIMKFPLKRGITKWRNPIFLEKLTLSLDSQFVCDCRISATTWGRL